ncbi:histone-lysine N-methyltransferase SUVR4 isoform X2 [Helianthus annuus]|uniref:histone-lysine N-methyltransferase SUVR4 isoform X2 n=1 Tax=Helianthus annuus TaxID=4232 RepID=UPI000B8F8605|nr:histone-lysine N-methyltransferase SUVR4 isoform X2 [Helianthus annuus]
MTTHKKDSKTSAPRAPDLNEQKQKVEKAYSAMADLGISTEVVKPVLKNLLNLYDGNWELIEEDKYRTLADAIFESSDDKKSIAEGSTSSNMNTVTHKKRRKIIQVEDDMEPIAKPTCPAVQSDNSNSLVKRNSKFHNDNDITRGTEKIKIPLIDEIGLEPPKFLYIPQNISYQDAYVPFSTARISDGDCCLKCTGDCLSRRVPCACSRETGGEFAYTSKGLLREEFLDACIEPKKHDLFYCQDCPLEKAKNDDNPEPCKGHVLRKFIKECWRKCGCTMNCGNRVVQRGPTCKLQVFSTEDKGWAVRSTQYLPKGSFICEYVGEILTNTELYERNKQSQVNERHTYPVLLDADWGSEQGLEDEEALCLDATRFGNVARFINHRCSDSNLIEIPVEIETPHHHYYHIAFFTKRDIDPFEELTWDYGIDFADVEHPIKAFKCQCASPHCRDVRRKVAEIKKKDSRGKKTASGSTSRGLNRKQVH